MFKKILFCFVLISYCATAQIGIGTTVVSNSAIMELESADRGLLIPRLTEVQKNAIPTPADGLLIYQTDAATGFWYFNGVIWTQFGGSGWSTLGDGGLTNGVNVLGTTDAQPLIFKTNNVEVARVNTQQYFGIGETNPMARLHISGVGNLFRLQNGTEALNRVLTSDAGGTGTWQTVTVGAGAGADDDWRVAAGDPGTLAGRLLRRGAARIGTPGAPAYLLHVDNGNATGTSIGLGDVEVISDGDLEIIFSHTVVPEIDDQDAELGAGGQRWTTVYATNGVIQTSDKRLKSKKRKLRYTTKDLMNLRPVTYYWKEEKHNDLVIPDNKKQKKIGFIAQEVLKIIPEAVIADFYELKDETSGEYVKQKGNGLMMNYETLIPLLVKTEQEQQKRIDTLIKRNKEIKEKILNKLKR